MTPIESRLTELEIKASFTEDLLDQLNLVIYRQQEQIDRLTRQLHQLRLQMPEAGSSAAHELPPHY
ncbi:MAG: slyX [Variovorax sp.]|nr:slyX [Variovorax sp.]